MSGTCFEGFFIRSYTMITVFIFGEVKKEAIFYE